MGFDLTIVEPQAVSKLMPGSVEVGGAALNVKSLNIPLSMVLTNGYDRNWQQHYEINRNQCFSQVLRNR
jgi:hypothetical protein